MHIKYDQKLNKLKGEKCWNIGRSIGSMLIIDLGRKKSYITSKGKVLFKGRHSIILEQCDWKLEESGKIITSSSKNIEHIDYNILQLKDRNLVDIDAKDGQKTSTFIFTDDLTLTTNPYKKKVVEWMIFIPYKKVIVKGPNSTLSIQDAKSK